MIENDENTLVLHKGQIATAITGADGLYEIAIKAISPGPRTEKEVGMVAQERGHSAEAPYLAWKTSLYLMAITLSNIWYKRLGHPDTTIFRRMLPLLAGHSLMATDANKVASCEAYIQGKMMKMLSQWQLPPNCHLHFINSRVTYAGLVIAIFSLSFCNLEFSVKRDKIYTKILRYCPCE